MYSMEQRTLLPALPGYVRLLCVLAIVLLVVSACVEMAIAVSGWWQGQAFPAIVYSWQQEIRDLQSYTIPDSPLVWTGTLLLDMLSLVPYYLALFCAAWLFWQFYCGRVWVSNTILVLKIVSALLLFDAVYPLIRYPLQVLLFTWSSKPILEVSFGFNSTMVRSFVIGFAVLVFSVTIDKAKAMEEEIKLII